MLYTLCVFLILPCRCQPVLFGLDLRPSYLDLGLNRKDPLNRHPHKAYGIPWSPRRPAAALLLPAKRQFVRYRSYRKRPAKAFLGP